MRKLAEYGPVKFVNSYGLCEHIRRHQSDELTFSKDAQQHLLNDLVHFAVFANLKYGNKIGIGIFKVEWSRISKILSPDLGCIEIFLILT